MKRLKIFCTSIKYYSLMDRLPNYIQPLGLGKSFFPSNWLDEKKGENISYLNNFYGELTGFYFVWKNQINDMNDTDLIGFCHYRKLWMNTNVTNKNKLHFNSIYSKLLSENYVISNNINVIQVRPITFKNKSLLSDFEEVHNCKVLSESVKFFSNTINSNAFNNHINRNILFPLNMFITTKAKFIDYCKELFPWLHKCYEHCLANNLLKGYNIRLPAFLGERFTSYWFSQFHNRLTLNYARLGNFFLNNQLNKYINCLKLPFTSRMYPTIHDY